MRYCIMIVFAVLFSGMAMGQLINTDTVAVSKGEIDSCFENSYHLSQQGNKYTYGNFQSKEKNISKEKYEALSRFYNCVCDSELLLKTENKYVKIYRNGKLYEEGYWYPEWIGGAYKKFYKNGHVKEEGNYTEYNTPFGPGKKTGKWTYYKKNGKIKDTLTYTPAIDTAWKIRNPAILH